MKRSILDILQGSEYVFGLLELFSCGSKRNTLEHLTYAKLIIVFIPNVEFPPYYKVIHGNATFKLTKG